MVFTAAAWRLETPRLLGSNVSVQLHQRGTKEFHCGEGPQEGIAGHDQEELLRDTSSGGIAGC